MNTAKCRHTGDFLIEGKVLRTDSQRFLASISIKCKDCNEEFEFYGMPIGLNLNGVSVSTDKKTAYLAVGTKETLKEYYARNAEQILKQKRINPLA